MKIALKAITTIAAAVILISACTRSSTTSEEGADLAMKAKMVDEKVEEAKEEEAAGRGQGQYVRSGHGSFQIVL
jgi:hypothetical protein